MRLGLLHAAFVRGNLRREAPKTGLSRRPGVIASQGPEPQQNQCRLQRQGHDNYEHNAFHAALRGAQRLR